MYIIPTVTFLSNFSPVRPSHKLVWPDEGNSANSNNLVTSSTEAPSNTGVDIGIPYDKLITNPIDDNQVDTSFVNNDGRRINSGWSVVTPLYFEWW